MPSESEKPIDQSRVTEPADDRAQDEATIKDLSPDRSRAADVRGGLTDGEANSEKIKGGILPPSEKPSAFLVPPST